MSCNGIPSCPDTCRSCLSGDVNDLISWCYDQYRSTSYSFLNVTELEEDECGNRYDTCNSTCIGCNCNSTCVGNNCNSTCVSDNCSGGAIAVPTVLTALIVLLMVMAAIVILALALSYNIAAITVNKTLMHILPGLYFHSF